MNDEPNHGRVLYSQTLDPVYPALRPAATLCVNLGKSYYRASGEGQAKRLRGLQAGSRLAGRQRRLEYVAGAVFFTTEHSTIG